MCLYLFEKLTSNALGFKQPSSSAVKAADTSPVVDQVAEEKKEGNLLARTDGHAPIKDRSPLGLNNWPLSRIDCIRQNPSKVAPLPSSASSLDDVDCPQCASILDGSVLHQRFLLLGHELQFAGGEIWLRDLGEMLESCLMRTMRKD